MSGSGSPREPRPPPPGDNGGGSDCGDLAFLTTLASPNPDEIDSLDLGDVLRVALIDEDDVTIIGVQKRGGEVIGSIVSGRLADLRACLQQGFEYRAEVKSVAGGAIRVRISAR